MHKSILKGLDRLFSTPSNTPKGDEADNSVQKADIPPANPSTSDTTPTIQHKESGPVDIQWIFETAPDLPTRIQQMRKLIGLPPIEWFDQFWFEAARADYRMRQHGFPEFIPIIFTAPANLGKSTIINSLVGEYLSAESWVGGATLRLVAIFHGSHAGKTEFLPHMYAKYKMLENPKESVKEGDQVLVAFNDGVPGESVVLYDIPGNNIEGLTIANRIACAQAILHVIVTNATFYNDEHQRELLSKIVKAGGTKQSVIIYRSDPSISPKVIWEHCRAIAELLYPEDMPDDADKMPEKVLGVYSVDPVPWQDVERVRATGATLPIELKPLREHFPSFKEVLQELDRHAVEIKQSKTHEDRAFLAKSLDRQLKEVERQVSEIDLARIALERVREQAAAGAIGSMLSEDGKRLIPTLGTVWNRNAPNWLRILNRISDRLSNPFQYLTEAARRFIGPGEGETEKHVKSELPADLLKDYRKDIERETRHLRGSLRSDGVCYVRNDELYDQSEKNDQLWLSIKRYRETHDLDKQDYPKLFDDSVEIRFPAPLEGRLPSEPAAGIEQDVEKLLDVLKQDFTSKFSDWIQEHGLFPGLYARTVLWPLAITLAAFVGICMIFWDLDLSLWPDVPLVIALFLLNPRLSKLAEKALLRAFHPLLENWFHENFHQRLSNLYSEAAIKPYEKALSELAIDREELDRLTKAIKTLKESS